MNCYEGKCKYDCEGICLVDNLGCDMIGGNNERHCRQDRNESLCGFSSDSCFMDNPMRMATEKRLADAKVIEYPWGYYEIKTEHFFSRVYKHGGGNGKPVTFRAECSVRIGKRNYLIVWRHFHEWDYRDREDAYNHAKCWIGETNNSLAMELNEVPTVDAVEVVHGRWEE